MWICKHMFWIKFIEFQGLGPVSRLGAAEYEDGDVTKKIGIKSLNALQKRFISFKFHFIVSECFIQCVQQESSWVSRFCGSDICLGANMEILFCEIFIFSQILSNKEIDIGPVQILSGSNAFRCQWWLCAVVTRTPKLANETFVSSMHWTYLTQVLFPREADEGGHVQRSTVKAMTLVWPVWQTAHLTSKISYCQTKALYFSLGKSHQTWKSFCSLVVEWGFDWNALSVWDLWVLGNCGHVRIFETLRKRDANQFCSPKGEWKNVALLGLEKALG